MPISYTDIGLQEPSTITNRVGTVTLTRNSTAMQQELLTLADPQTTNALARVTDTTPDSTMFGMVVREAVPQSTVMAVSSVSGRVLVEQNSTVWFSHARIFDSSGVAIATSTAAPATGDNGLTVRQVGYVAPSTIATISTGSVRVHQSSAADLNVTVAGYVAPSTVMTVSTGSVRVHQSSAADLNVTVAGYVAPSTIVSVSTGSVRVHQSTAADLLVTATIGTNLQSTAAPSSGSSGLIVRQVIDALTTFASTSALASTSIEIQSSGAGIRSYVTAYIITSTNQTPAHWGFFSSNGTLLWPITMAALSSAVTGANLAVAPPGYLFRTAASDALNFKTAGSTVAGVQLGVSFFRAP